VCDPSDRAANRIDRNRRKGQKMTTQPCVKDCPNRTLTCKFDGTCSKCAEWNEIHAQEKKTERIVNLALKGAKQIRTASRIRGGGL